MMRRLVLSLLLVVVGARQLRAAPDPDATQVAAAVTPPVADHRVIGAVVLGTVYVGIAAWMKFAWYTNQPTLPEWRWGDEGWFGDKTYAGGSDKFGHAWGAYVFSRLGTKLLRDTGWPMREASVISATASMVAFTLVEVKDGYYYEGSSSDLAGDAFGTALSVLMDNWPALDDALDYRVQWTPSIGYRLMCSQKGITSSGCLDFVEDYSGERFMFAYKPRSIRAVRESDGLLRYVQYVDPVLGFQSHDYKPLPEPTDTVPRRQEIFIGVSLDLQAFFDDVLGHRTSRAARVTRGITHTVFEYANLPFTSTPVLSYNHSPDEGDFIGAFR